MSATIKKITVKQQIACVEREIKQHYVCAHRLRVQRRRTKGAQLPKGAVCVTRPGPWGNPFRVESCIEAGYADNEDDAREMCVKAFQDWLLKGDLSDWWFEDSRDRWEWMRANLKRLYGKQLACFCPLDRPCHADVLAELANAT